MSFEQTQLQQRNFEQNTLVWFNENIKNENEINNIKVKLRSIINYLRIFDDIDGCIDYISSNETERIYLIITSSSANVIIPCIDEIEQIKMIYIFTLHQLQINASKKSIRIHDNLLTLCDTIKNDVSLKKLTYNSSDLDFSSLSSSTKNRLDRQEAAFIYFRLLTETLVGLKHKQSIRDEFISFCRQQYDGNKFEIEKIEEFQRTYSKKNAIRWYTRDSFLYRILNNALRIQDIEILYQLGFFIADLYCELKSLCISQLKSLTLPSVVYRGQFMAKYEFDNKIRNNIGGFLSINSFFSTSVNKQVALMFTNTSSPNQPNIESILFEITIDFQKCQRSIADIKQFSYMHEEDEILFSMGTVFRIKSVERSNSHNIWIVDLLMNGEEDEELKSISDNFKAISGSFNDLNSLSGLLLEMGEFEKAKQFMLMLIKDTSSEKLDLIYSYYSNLSAICNNQKNYDEGVLWAEKALQISSNKVSTQTDAYVNAGFSYTGKNDFIKAKNCFHKVIESYKDNTLKSRLKLALTYCTLGLIHVAEKDASLAFKYLFQAVNIYENLLPKNYSDLAIAYWNIAATYESIDDNKSALIYLFKCIDIQEKYLPAKHPHLVDSYYLIGICYMHNLNYEEAHKYFQKLLEITDFLPPHLYYSSIIYRIAVSYMTRIKASEALHYLHKSLDIQIKLPLPTDSLLIDIYYYISLIYCFQSDYISSIDYCQKAIPIALKCNDKKLVSFYNTITSNFILLRDIKQATHYAKLALDFANAMLPPNHTFMDTVNHNASLLLPSRRSLQ